MSADHAPGDDFLSGFMDDYFAECDEHLTAIRRTLLVAESTNVLAAAALDELFRGVHSLKGLSGIVELKDAELLSHHLESYLGALRRQAVQLTPAGLSGLIEGTRLLEQVIASRRDGQTAPSIEGMVAAIEALAGPAATGDAAPFVPERTPARAAADSSGLPRWAVIFTPSSELASAGVGVDRVRALLREAGEILEAAPRVGAGRRDLVRVPLRGSAQRRRHRRLA